LRWGEYPGLFRWAQGNYVGALKDYEKDLKMEEVTLSQGCRAAKGKGMHVGFVSLTFLNLLINSSSVF
jgi:hypothetical protein